MAILSACKYLPKGSINFTGYIKQTVDFVKEKQLLKKELWSNFVKVFTTKEDGDDFGWRGEYWGKMMRGACLIYLYDDDEQLYEAIDYAVTELLKVQDEYGRISTYSIDKEFNGWDIWSRKYVLVGLQHYYQICKDENKKAKVLSAMIKHADYLISKIGTDKIDILKTSTNIWGGLNSATILEPICELYKITNEKRYLIFAEYLIASGGCFYGNLIELAEKDEIQPYQYPVVKAYEMMSFFEGVLAYYECTGNKRYFEVVKKFIESILISEYTIVGGAGCSHEFLDKAVIKQSEFTDKPMQETCVTVTLMRIVARLYLLTGESKYINAIECSAFNALYGSINDNMIDQFSYEENKCVSGLPFDSYSPLAFSRRGSAIGGFKKFSFGGHYGCCACIGAAGIALVPLTSVVKTDDGFVINNYSNCTINCDGVNISVNSDYFKDGKVEIKFNDTLTKPIQLKLLIPSWVNRFGTNCDYIEENGYIIINKSWKKNDIISLNFSVDIEEISVNGRVALKYGGLVLSQENVKDYEFGTPLKLLRENGKLKYTVSKVKDMEYAVTFFKNNGSELVLKNYSSVGKNPFDKTKIVNTWFNIIK